MSIGETIRLKQTVSKDPLTGVDVTRLTDSRRDTIHPYFTQPLFSLDGETLLVTSNRTGWWQLYRLDIPDKTLIQLTEDDDVKPHSPCLDGKRMIAYYWTGKTLKSVDLETFEQEIIYRVPDDCKPSILSISSDGRYLAFSYSENLPLSTVKGKAYSGFLEKMFRRPRSVVIRIDLKKMRAEPLWGECAWISHVNISPVNPDIVVFCHEGPWRLVQRLWVVKADTLEVYPLFKQRRNLDAVGHEFFTVSGRLVAQYSTRSRPNSQDWTHYDAFLWPDGSELELYRYPADKPTHIKTSNRENMAVGDRAYPSQDFKEGDKYIALITYRDGEAIPSPLCRHGSSWRTQTAHPHPIFTPDDKHVIFTSDIEGVCNVYMSPVDSHI